jgi:hypothetical protein
LRLGESEQHNRIRPVRFVRLSSLESYSGLFNLTILPRVGESYS